MRSSYVSAGCEGREIAMDWTLQNLDNRNARMRFHVDEGMCL
jgi:hypothetical protein